MMKAAENGAGCDCSDGLNRPMDGSVQVQSTMGPHAIVMGGILAKDPAQVGLSERDQVVEAFPPDRADQSLRVPIATASRARSACPVCPWRLADA